MPSVMRTLFPALAVLAIALPLGACGDDEDGGGGEGEKTRKVSLKLSGSDENLKMSAPKSVAGGVLRIEFTNSAAGEHDHGAQLGYVDEGHTPQEGLRAAAAWGEEGKALPGWVHLAGGVGSTAPGATRSVTQELPAGRYFAVDIESGASAYFSVSGAGGGTELPSAPGRIATPEYKFEASGLEDGTNRVLIDNVGAEPHIVSGARLKPGKTIEDVREFFRTEKGEEPIVEGEDFDTAILDGGVKQVVEIAATPGEYALLCFVPDRKGGPPHFAKGMISPATVR
jgi:hypothetical protein